MADELPSDVDTASGRNMFALLLIAGGVLLVVFAPGLGTLLVQHVSGSGISWSPDEANAMATNLRCLGFLAFLGGCAERIILAIDRAAAREDKPV